MKGAQSARPILIVGGTGQLGFELLRELAGSGPLLNPARAELDLSSEESIRRYVRTGNPRAIINAAAYTAVDRAETEPDLAAAVNSVAPGVLAVEARRLGAPLIHYSTDYVFDGTNAGGYVETDATNPLGVYGQTKLNGEEAVRANAESWLVLRCSWVYSLRGSNFLRTMLRLGAEKTELAVVDDQTGSPTWAREIARATSALLSFAAARGSGITETIAERAGVYHLTSPDHATWYEFARAIFDRHQEIRTTVRPIRSSEYVTPARRPANSVLDSSKIAATFGVCLPSWKDQLDQCLATKQ